MAFLRLSSLAIALSVCFHPAVSASPKALFPQASSSFASGNLFQLASEQWQLLESEHFILAYPPELSALAVNAIHELEQSHQLLLQHQQRSLARKAEVVLFDPLNAANGVALPLTFRPTMALFATPPQSDTLLSDGMTSWMQLVALHEYVHLVHLAQPSRSAWRNQLAKIWQNADISSATRVPRWVAEGYATLLESTLTGGGRLYSPSVEAWLQQLAIEGALPGYDELDKTSGRYQAGGFAYNLGSRYLNWLEQSYGSDSLDAIWTRMAGKKNRSFDEAFQGVYGASAQQLYQRFVAEYTFQAMQQQQAHQPMEASLWHDSSGVQQTPALSPNGQWLALVEQDAAKFNQLVVLAVDDRSKAEETFQKSQQKLLARDPEDIADIPPTVFQQKQAYVLSQRNFAGVRDPRWLSNDSLVFGADTLNPDGSRQQDLFRWDLSSNRVSRLSRGQSLRRYDISPDGQHLIAERHRHGFGQLVQLDLTSLELSELTAPALEEVFDFPRYAPDQSQFAVVHFAPGKGWQLQLRQSDSPNTAVTVPMPADSRYVSYPSWSLDGHWLYFVANQQSRLVLFGYHLPEQQLYALSDGAEMVQMVVPLSDGHLLAQLMNQDGPDLYKLGQLKPRLLAAKELAPKDKGQPLTEATAWLRPQSSSRSLASLHHQSKQQHLQTEPNTEVRRELTMPTARVHQTLPAESRSSDYGLGPRQHSMNLQAHYSSANSNVITLGIKGGDLVKRLDYQFGAGFDSSGDFKSLFTQALYQGWPVKVQLEAQKTTLSLKHLAPFTEARQRSDGAMLQFSLPWQKGMLRLDQQLQLRYLDRRLEQQLGEHTISSQIQAKNSASFSAIQQWQHQRNRWGFGVQQQLAYHQTLKETDATGWRGSDWQLRVRGRLTDFLAEVSYLQMKRWQPEGQLSLGGFHYAGLSQAIDPNRLIAPELSFGYQLGHTYQQTALSLSHRKLQPLKLVYRRHEIDQQPRVDAYGLQLQQRLGVGLGPVFVNDLYLDVGVFRVDPELQKGHNRYWLTVGYQF